MKTQICTLITGLVVISLTGSLAGAKPPARLHWIPNLMNYQGVLTDSVGNPLDGVYAMCFSIYDDSTGGTVLWTECHDSVDVSGGRFTVLLGSVEEITSEVFITQPVWLEIQVGGEITSPRRMITSAGYAFHAEYAGIDYFIPPEPVRTDSDHVVIRIPHYCPFELVISSLQGAPDAIAWIAGAENDNYFRWVGLDDDGNVVRGSCSLNSEDTILTVYPGLVLRAPGHTVWHKPRLILDSSGWGGDSRAVIIPPHTWR